MLQLIVVVQLEVAVRTVIKPGVADLEFFSELSDLFDGEYFGRLNLVQLVVLFLDVFLLDQLCLLLLLLPALPLLQHDLLLVLPAVLQKLFNHIELFLCFFLLFFFWLLEFAVLNRHQVFDHKVERLRDRPVQDDLVSGRWLVV